MTEEIEEQLELIDYTLYNIERDMQRLRDRLDNLKILIEVNSK